MFEWYQENNFKCHLFTSLLSNNKTTIANYNITSGNSEVLLGEFTDSKTTFAKPRKTNQKLHVLVRVANFMALKTPLSYETFFPPNLINVLLYRCVTVENLITNLINHMNGLLQ